VPMLRNSVLKVVDTAHAPRIGTPAFT
jgi:hypothetical protein